MVQKIAKIQLWVQTVSKVKKKRKKEIRKCKAIHQKIKTRNKMKEWITKIKKRRK
jgi:hypothetical protein